MGCTAALMSAVVQPVKAADSEITDVELNTTADGIELVFRIQGNARPPIFTVNRGNSSVSDISNTQLRLPGGQPFRQINPAPGITAVEVVPIDANTIRITVDGAGAAPITDIVRQDSRSGILVLNFERPSDVAVGPTPPPGLSQQPPSESTPSAVPPFARRAVPPPVGDMAIAPLNVEPDRIELNSGQIIPKLLLREAPVREVLSLLGRAASVNVVFAEEEGGNGNGPTISLDIENETVDDVFNYVIRMAGLQSNRIGQTVFVGRTLPGDAQNRIVRSIRLNQIKATAQTTSTRSLRSNADTGGTVAEGEGALTLGNTALNRTSAREEQIQGSGAKEILESYGANGGGEGGVSTLLEGLEVIADSRINTVTLIGTPRKVQIATSLLSQLDVRRRQVAINVKFIDVNLLRGKNSNVDLQFRANDQLGLVFGNAGLGIAVGSGRANVPVEGGGTRNTGLIGNVLRAVAGGGAIDIATEAASRFLGQILMNIQNDNAKILTNPTLLVQEGSSAQVNLTQQIFSGFRQTDTESAAPAGGATSRSSLEPIFQNAGVILNVDVDNIDDNGFITLNVTPEVSSPSGTFTDQFGNTAGLLQQRRLETGTMRLRDGQTLVLAGIIQDQDRIAMNKVPILGDIPILGRLFRRETSSRQRSELVVFVTPQIVDDSDQSAFGYQYQPGPETERLMNR
nr:AMIN domain-containing protein [Petrachloros mirabilis]